MSLSTWASLRSTVGAGMAVLIGATLLSAAPEATASTSLPAATATVAQPPSVGASAGLDLAVQFHGMWEEYTDEQRHNVLGQLEAAGVRTVKLDVSWESLQPYPVPYYEPKVVALLDSVIAMIHEHGMSVTVMFWLTPYWARSPGIEDDRSPPLDPTRYAAAIRWAAHRYAGKVAAWEIWTQPNGPEYVTLLRASYQAVKAVDPHALVVLGSILYNDAPVLERFYENGAKGYFDVVSTQAYPGLADESPLAPDSGQIWSFAHFDAIREIMRHNDDENHPMWTGVGYSTHSNPRYTLNWYRGVSEATQARYLTEAVARIRREFPWISQFCWYNDRDSDFDTVSHFRHYGLLRADLSAKPALAALRTAIAAGAPAVAITAPVP